jgi:nicotinate-nucleotide pyrophosphorylase (carboxylating)
MPLDPAEVARAVALALAEDLGAAGDVTSQAVVPRGSTCRARLVARQALVVAGLEVARTVFLRADPGLAFEPLAGEGNELERGQLLATLGGSTAAILLAERTALNFLGRMCGIATATRAAVREIEGTGAVILDTRKTAPGLRAFDKEAVAVGGGSNHRRGLYDAVMIKDTHLDAGISIADAVARARERGHPVERITVEVRDERQLAEAIAAGAGRVLLDNMELEELRGAVRFAAGRVKLEASGGLRPGRLREVAATGVDFLSLGWLTHSAPAADVALETEVER